MHYQAIVDSSKRFLNIHVGMPSSTNDSQVLCKSALFLRVQWNSLWDEATAFQGFEPYFMDDSGYPLLAWLMVPHAQRVQLSMADELFNQKLLRDRGVVEIAFGLLKQSFKELQTKSDIDVTFLLDVVICCAQLHNLLLDQSQQEVKRLLQVLGDEGGIQDVIVDNSGTGGRTDALPKRTSLAAAKEKRQDLGMYLAADRIFFL